MSLLIFFLLLCHQFSRISSVGDDEALTTDFCYVDPECGPENWPGICTSGTMQSPIDFDGSHTSVKFIAPTLKNYFRELYVHQSGYTRTFLLENMGHTMEVRFPHGKEPILNGKSIDLPGNYKYEQMHFHWGATDYTGSEHTINGVSSAMECHMVHYSTKYSSFKHASNRTMEEDPYAVAIIAILFKIDDFDNEGLQPVTDSMHAVREFVDEDGTVEVQRSLNLKRIFPANSEFYRYRGSLTAPSCAENKIWTVFKTPVKISRRQLHFFRTMFQKNNEDLQVLNHRPVQARNGREITLYVQFNLLEFIWQLFKAAIKFVISIFTRPNWVMLNRIEKTGQVLQPICKNCPWMLFK